MRPLVSNINSVTSKVAEWLVRKFKKFKPPNSLSIKNSSDMAREYVDTRIGEHECLISFDIESLFPSIPVDEAFEKCKGWIDSQDISDEEAELCVALMEIVLNQRVFEFEGEFYKQLNGLFIGNNLSSIITEVFLGDIEMSYMNEPWWPKKWMRMVDDTIGIVNKTEVDLITENLNKIHPAIRFTREEEKENSIPFLDTRLIREDKKISIDIYRKPTDAPLCIPNKSLHHYNHKRAAFQSAIFRMWNLPLSNERRKIELQYLMKMALINGYDPLIVEKMNERQENKMKLMELTKLQPEEKKTKRKTIERNGKSSTHLAILPFYPPLSFKVESVLRKNKINVCYQNRRKLKNILGNGKGKRSDEESAGIYEIECKDCDEKYIGQTQRQSETRDKEHTAAIKSRQKEKSSVARHCIENNHRRGEMKLLKRIDEPKKLDAYESLFIATTENLMNTGEPPIVSKLFNFVK